MELAVEAIDDRKVILRIVILRVLLSFLAVSTCVASRHVVISLHRQHRQNLEGLFRGLDELELEIAVTPLPYEVLRRLIHNVGHAASLMVGPQDLGNIFIVLQPVPILIIAKQIHISNCFNVYITKYIITFYRTNCIEIINL